jgi:hypothetical protein
MAWLACSLLPAQAAPVSQATRVVGYVRDAATQRYLYTEVHVLNLGDDGAVQAGVTTYYDPQGREIARKTLDYRGNRTVPIYRMDMPALRYAEGISSNSPQALIFKRDKDEETRKALPLDDGPVAADAGFNQLLQDQLPAILQGDTVRFGLIVAGYANRFKFRAKKVGEPGPDGQTTLRVLVEPDSMLRMLVSPISLSYDIKSRRLLSYQGVSNIIDPDTAKVYKNISIVYGGTAPAEARLPPP